MADFTEKQKLNLQFYKDHLQQWLNETHLKEKYIVIHDEDIKGTYDTFEAALKFAIENFPKVEFIIQQVISTDSYINYLKDAV